MNRIDRDKFIEENMGLVKMVAQRYRSRVYNNPILDYEDIEQIGTIGLIKAANRFDSSYGTQFSTYAVSMIEGEIKEFFRDNADTLKVPRKVKINFNNIYRNNLLDENYEAIATKLNLPIEEVKEALEYGNKSNPISMHDVLFDDDRNSKAIYVKDKLSYEEDFDTRLEIDLFLKQLNERERVVMELRMKEMTQHEIAKKLCISQVYVGILLGKIRNKLEMYLEIKRSIPNFEEAKKLARETQFTPREIAEKTGVAYTTAARYVREYRTKKKQEKLENEKIA